MFQKKKIKIKNKIIEQREREIVNGIEEGSEVCNLK